MIGQTISHYRITSKIGEGGMGEVYRATDTKLNRDVALKVLPGAFAADRERMARFSREAQVLASLNHPNIASIYGLEDSDDKHALVLELVEGETLAERVGRGTVPLEESLKIALQMAEALEAAHEKGIIHRDLKPANVKITPEGKVKVLDFGIAKLTGLESGAEVPTRLTVPSTPMGTISYMSPEQALGQGIDVRTDVFSMGAVLYELITGRPPFQGETAVQILNQTLNSTPPAPTTVNPEVPLELEQIVLKALSKDVQDRYQSTQELRRDIERFGKTSDTGSGPPSIAVLPLLNLSADPENEYFSDGLAEELINALAQVEGLKVASRTSAFGFKGRAQDIRVIGEKLKVGAVLEGSVRKSGSRVRIIVQLTNTKDGYQLWSEKFDRVMDDVFAIQEEIAQAITERLQVRRLGEQQENLVERLTHDAEAYNLYLKGLYFWNRRTDADLLKARSSFELAAERDPSFAQAMSGLADTYAILGMAEYGICAPRDVLPRAKERAQRALDLNPRLAEAQTTLAHVTAFYDWDWDEAERQFQRAIELNPEYPMSHHWYALFLAAMERHDDALREERLALELAPTSLIINKNVGTILHYQGDYDGAIEVYQETLELDPHFSRAHFYLGASYVQVGKYREAIVEFQRATELTGGNTVSLAMLAHALAVSGRRDEALHVLEELRDLSKTKDRFVGSISFAFIHLGLGDEEETFECLSNALTERSSWLVSLRVEPLFNPTRTDERFEKLMREVGLSCPT